jgi:hypothetical protein
MHEHRQLGRHIAHNHICVPSGQVLAKEAFSLPPLSTCFINHVFMCAHFALLYTCCQLKCVGHALTTPQRWLAPSTLLYQIAFVLDKPQPSSPEPELRGRSQGFPCAQG